MGVRHRVRQPVGTASYTTTSQPRFPQNTRTSAAETVFVDLLRFADLQDDDAFMAVGGDFS